MQNVFRHSCHLYSSDSRLFDLKSSTFIQMRKQDTDRIKNDEENDSLAFKLLEMRNGIRCGTFCLLSGVSLAIKKNSSPFLRSTSQGNERVDVFFFLSLPLCLFHSCTSPVLLAIASFYSCA